MNASGREAAALGVVPADERLDAGDAAGLQRDDRLVDEPELSRLDAAGEVGLELEPLEGARVHLLLEQLDAVLALLLGQVHGHVGVAQHDLGRRRPVVDRGDADAGGDHDLAAVDAERAAEVVEQAQGEADRADLVAAVLDQHRELVAAEAGRHRVAGQGLAESLGHPDQQLVADRVAEAVVDGLEVVEVDEQHAGHAACGAAPIR